MKDPIFKLILFKVGEKFLQYILNYNEPIIESKKFTEYGFMQCQTEALNLLNSLIEKCEAQVNENPHSTIKKYLSHSGITFNHLREQCGGSIPKKIQKEELTNYLFAKATEFYPSLLLTDNNQLFTNLIFSESYFPKSLKEGDRIYKLLISHPNYKNLITVEKETSLSRLTYILSNNSSFSCFLIDFPEQIILRAFLNCCYKIKYDLLSLLTEIELQLLNLDKIAKKETICVSFFGGIYGLKLDDLEEYNFAENIIIRNINEINNPGIKNTVALANSDKYSNLITGCTLEYQINLTSLGKIEASEFSITENNQFANDIFDILIYSHVIGLNSAYPPLSITFFDRGIPLAIKYPQTIEYQNTEISILPKEKLVKIKEWFDLLNSIDLNRINLTLSRIKSAIYNRTHPLDSILDAFIAWESMFSSEISTTNSVVKSISNILKRANYEISKKKLNDLYSLRSSIVHGSPFENKLFLLSSTLSPFLLQEEIKKQTINIAIYVLKELIKDDLLFNKTPNERVQLLLSPTIISCEKCNIKRYKFD